MIGDMYTVFKKSHKNNDMLNRFGFHDHLNCKAYAPVILINDDMAIWSSTRETFKKSFLDSRRRDMA